MQSDVTTCDFCGLAWQEGDSPGEWLTLEVARSDGASEMDWIIADFCSQTHAAQWLKRPLPPPQPMWVLPRTWWDRLTDALLFVLFLSAVALMMLGVYALVRLLGGWD